jgi:hypothetical protein
MVVLVGASGVVDRQRHGDRSQDCGEIRAHSKVRGAIISHDVSLFQMHDDRAGNGLIYPVHRPRDGRAAGISPAFPRNPQPGRLFGRYRETQPADGLPPDEEGELGLLANNVQELATRLQETIGQFHKSKDFLKDTVADISHNSKHRSLLSSFTSICFAKPTSTRPSPRSSRYFDGAADRLKGRGGFRACTYRA